MGRGGRGARGRPRRGRAGLPRQPGRRRARLHARAGARAAPARHPGAGVVQRAVRGGRIAGRAARARPAGAAGAAAGRAGAAGHASTPAAPTGSARWPRWSTRRPRCWSSTTTPPTPASARSTWSTRPPRRPRCWSRSWSAGSASRSTADIAACLYTGLVTDTGSFRYAATTPEVHELAARLLATGIRHDLIARRSGTPTRSASSGCSAPRSAGPGWSRTRPAASAWSGPTTRRPSSAAAGLGLGPGARA